MLLKVKKKRMNKSGRCLYAQFVNVMVFVVFLEDYFRYAHGLISEYISEDLSKDLLKHLQYVHIHMFSCTYLSHHLKNLMSSQTGTMSFTFSPLLSIQSQLFSHVSRLPEISSPKETEPPSKVIFLLEIPNIVILLPCLNFNT